MYGYILLNDIINKKFLIGKSNISEEQMEQLKSINSQINKDNDQILFENVDKALNDEVLDILDIDFIKNSISIIPSSQENTIDQQITNSSSIISHQPTNNNNNIANTVNSNVNIANANNSILNTNISLEHLKQVFTESITAQNLCSKLDLNNYVQEKFNEFGSLFITTTTAEEHINSIEDLLTKQMKLENDDKKLELHLNNKTVPGSLDHKNFPNPLFQDDRCYIDNYNRFITKHQEEWIKFNREQISIKHDKLNKDILNLKMMVRMKYTDVDNIMLGIKEKLNKNLKDEFTNAHKKLLNIVNKKYEVRSTVRITNNTTKKKKTVDKFKDINNKQLSDNKTITDTYSAKIVIEQAKVAKKPAKQPVTRTADKVLEQLEVEEKRDSIRRSQRVLSKKK
jgi:hypothetical protein